jgi:toxin ParE1/3/4
MRIAYSRRALSQLAAVHEYLAERSTGGAHNVTASIRRTIARLRDLPLLGKPTDEASVHVLIEPKYRYCVFYRVGAEVVTAIRILHSSQL